MKIAMIDFVLETDKPGTSGLSDVVWNTARELAKLGDDIHIIGPYMVDLEPISGITVHRFELPPIGYRNILGHIFIVLRAWRIARQIPDLDVIYAPEYLSTGMISPFSKVPVVLRAPGNIYERVHTSNPFDSATTLVYKLAAKSSARFCSLVVAISWDQKFWWGRTGVPEEKLHVLPNGIDVDLFTASRGEQCTSKPEDSNSFRILYVGRLSMEKDVDTLISAVGLLNDKDIPFRLDIIGEGPRKDVLARQSRERSLEGVVKFHGNVPKHELPSWYTSSTVFVLPSRSEPLGRVMLEAMACGTPVVGSQVGGIPDHVIPGETGYLFQPGDYEELAHLLRQLVESPEEVSRLGENAHAHVYNQLPWARVVSRLRQLIANSTRDAAKHS